MGLKKKVAKEGGADKEEKVKTNEMKNNRLNREREKSKNSSTCITKGNLMDTYSPVNVCVCVCVTTLHTVTDALFFSNHSTTKLIHSLHSTSFETF